MKSFVKNVIDYSNRVVGAKRFIQKGKKDIIKIFQYKNVLYLFYLGRFLI